MTEREAFEEKMCHKLVGVFDNDLNCYTELTDQLMWEAWQAAKVQDIPERLVLNKPAKVGSGTFGIGVKWSIVIGAAQRQFEYAQNDIGEKAYIQNLKGILVDVPEGFVVVPKEPTVKVLDAARYRQWDDFSSPLEDMDVLKYKAMIEAAQEKANESERVF